MKKSFVPQKYVPSSNYFLDRKRMNSTATIHIAHYQSDVALNETIAIVDRVLAMTDRVLNSASHGNTTPLYQEEVKKALRLIERLESCLTANS